ncbi:MarR family transcriptional regulator [Nocardia sp. R6R-6]|uniref:MarR family transcriptional regulator n=1 Tax=Nocardia sp. R6R-6 TaxID=3459303 RepID=UPI00403DEDDC
MSIVWHLIRIARHAEHRLEFEVHRPLGWTWAGFRIMANIHVLGPLEPSKLAELIEVSRPTISAALQKLERDGYVTREEHPTARRRSSSN